MSTMKNNRAASRLRKNLSYFRTNYAAVLAAILAFSLLSPPTLPPPPPLPLLAARLFLYLFRPSDAPSSSCRAFSDRET
ncbi:hypothetical protein Scep_022402 [Stephania cephalantha]|uniref:PRA1 family protein n=1 Tax=Stephania cephalantha TaxID=152367 RepID=A0AAP0FAD4_9MAGN